MAGTGNPVSSAITSSNTSRPVAIQMHSMHAASNVTITVLFQFRYHYVCEQLDIYAWLCPWCHNNNSNSNQSCSHCGQSNNYKHYRTTKTPIWIDHPQNCVRPTTGEWTSREGMWRVFFRKITKQLAMVPSRFSWPHFSQNRVLKLPRHLYRSTEPSLQKWASHHRILAAKILPPTPKRVLELSSAIHTLLWAEMRLSWGTP